MLPTTHSKKLDLEETYHRQPVRLKVVCIDISEWPKTIQFLSLCAAVFVFYLLYGYMQELIFRLPGMRPFGVSLTLLQFIIYSCMSFTEMKLTSGLVRNTRIDRIPWPTYFQIAFYTVATMALSNASVGYLNYPTQVIFKCCKLIPVLIGGIIIQGKRYGLIDVAAAALMSLGLIMFSLADSHVSPNFHPRGYVMISLALVADAIIGNVQEKAMKSHGALNSEVVLYSYSLGSLYILAVTLVTGELQSAIAFFLLHPTKTFGYIAILSFTGYFGLNIVLDLVRISGALVAVTVTTMRKAVTIVLSFILFSKPFTITYVWAGLIILISIYLNVYSKNKKAFDEKIREWWSGWMQMNPKHNWRYTDGGADTRRLISV